MTDSLTERWARLFAEAPAPRSGAARGETRRTLLNYLGCVAGGTGHDTVVRAAAALGIAGSGDATLIGRRERTDPFHAALINGIAVNVYGFDDTHLQTVIHPAGPVASALFALADTRSLSGRAFVDALILGVEAECRLGLAAGPEHMSRGWHATGTAGVFGAAVAVGAAVGLEAGRMTAALALAACQPVGLRHNFGSMAVSFHVGRAAQNGLTAALLAEQGFAAGADAIGGPAGWAEALGATLDRDILLRPIEPPFEIERNTYKAFASGIVTHPAMEAAIRIARGHDVAPAQVSRIVVRGHPLVRELTGTMAPASALGCKVSIAHAVAVALAERRGGPAQFGERAFRDPAVARLRGRVALEVDPALDRDAAGVSVELEDGRILSEHVDHVIGSLARPMTDADLADKVRTLTVDLLSPAEQARLIALVAGVDEIAEVSALAAATVPQAASSRPGR